MRFAMLLGLGLMGCFGQDADDDGGEPEMPAGAAGAAGVQEPEELYPTRCVAEDAERECVTCNREPVGGTLIALTDERGRELLWNPPNETEYVFVAQVGDQATWCLK